MRQHIRAIVCTCLAVILAGPLFAPEALAQKAGVQQRPQHQHAKKAPARPQPATARGRQLPPRTPFTAAEDAAAVIPDMPDARFWADSESDFTKALPAQPGPWLILSTGGSDGAFGAGLLNGLSAAGNRPDYAVVTGVSTGALMAPFAFVGAKYDDSLKAAYTHITAADVFEAGSTGESFVDSWPLKDLLGKLITSELLTEVAAEYRRGRRLFVVTTDLDAERSVVWNMGAIAAHGDDTALDLFRNVLLASGSVPGAFPPVLIDVEGNGKRFQEMHVDGGVGGQFFIAPQALMQSSSGYRIPATQLYIVVNAGLEPAFAEVARSTPMVLAQSVAMAVQVDLRTMIDRAFVAANNSGIGFNVATIPASFSVPSRGAFDPDYMNALYDVGFAQGKSAKPFATAPPAFPARSSESTDPENPRTTDIAKPGAEK